MTREGEIEQQAFVYYESCSDEDIAKSKGFIEGAKWADRTMLDHACEWLKENIDLYSCNAFNTKSGYTEITLTDEFETAFRQAMKGEL